MFRQPSFRTAAEAISVQTEHLSGWKSILTPLVFAKLSYRITYFNREAIADKAPHRVKLGMDIDREVHRLMWERADTYNIVTPEPTNTNS